MRPLLARAWRLLRSPGTEWAAPSVAGVKRGDAAEFVAVAVFLATAALTAAGALLGSMAVI